MSDAELIDSTKQRANYPLGRTLWSSTAATQLGEELSSVGRDPPPSQEYAQMTGWRLPRLFKRGSGPHMQSVMINSLHGYFELRVDRIVGWVGDIYGFRNTGMRIEVFGRGGMIASCAAIPQPQQQCFDFSLHVEGRFTGAELVREEVYVVARDGDGNSGRILLDGAAQLELAREYLGVPATTVLDLDFARGGNAASYLGVGWSGTEPKFTWTENYDSFINFDTPTTPGTYALRITAGAVIRKPDLSTQDLAVFINDVQVAHIVYTEALVQFQECKFPHEVFAQAPRTTLRLHHPAAVRPFEVGLNSDRRCLAFSFKRLTLVRLTPSPIV